jgi:hypothetical protein
MTEPVTLEILVCPPDIGYIGETLRHQLRIFGEQVDEVVFAADVKTPSRGRYANGWGEALPALEALLLELCLEHPNARVVRAEGDPTDLAELGRRYFGGRTIPAKDPRGMAFEAYFTGFDSASNDLVLHVDGDMLFGGGSLHWVQEAVELLRADSDVVSVIPLSGPPRPDGQMLGQSHLDGRYEHPLPAYRVDQWTTRVALLDRRRIVERLTPLPLSRPPHRRTWLKAIVYGNPLVGMPEDIVDAQLRAREMYRIDLLGSEPGMWTVHPLLKPPEFLRDLPEIIARVEAGEVPSEQLGHYDIVDAFVDQSEARRQPRQN